MAAVIIAAAFFLVYLLYRFLNLYTIAFVGIVALLVLGYGLHDSTMLGQMVAGQSVPPLRCWISSAFRGCPDSR